MSSMGRRGSAPGPVEGSSSDSDGMPCAMRRAISTTSDQTADAVGI